MPRAMGVNVLQHAQHDATFAARLANLLRGVKKYFDVDGKDAAERICTSLLQPGAEQLGIILTGFTTGASAEADRVICNAVRLLLVEKLLQDLPVYAEPLWNQLHHTAVYRDCQGAPESSGANTGPVDIASVIGWFNKMLTPHADFDNVLTALTTILVPKIFNITMAIFSKQANSAISIVTPELQTPPDICLYNEAAFGGHYYIACVLVSKHAKPRSRCTQLKLTYLLPLSF